MPKLMSFEELQKLREKVKVSVDLREKGEKVEQMTVITVAMGDKGIANGAKEIMDYLSDEIRARGLNEVMVIQGECVGDCELHPVIEVAMLGKNIIRYEKVTKERAQLILEKYIMLGEDVDGMIPIERL